MKKKRNETAPSGLIYRLWENGDGVHVFSNDDIPLHDAGSHVGCIPLIDVPFLAQLLAQRQTPGAAPTVPETET